MKLNEVFYITSDSEVHDAKACVKLDGCCDIEYPIQVKKCQDGKYVYNLTEPEACDLAYCAGEGQPCAAGTVWVESENACTGKAVLLLFSSLFHHNRTLKQPYCYNCHHQNLEVTEMFA